MMFRFLLATATVLSSIIMPMSAHAYLTPDEVLDDEDYSTRFYDPPPSRRENQALAAEREREAAERREAELDALYEQQNPSSEPMRGAAPDENDGEETDIDALIKALEEYNNTHGAAPDAEPTDEGTTGGSGSEQMTPEELRDARLLARLRNREIAEDNARYDAWLAAQGGDDALRSGAPLSDTGPTTVIVLLAVTAAVGETWRRVRKAERA
jgi:hypothetical protein